ncbi:MAG TPA: EpsI family protein [Opitutaceae bacterium]|nr:EpsI family protein [Opitutaceae bacterium]
MTSRPPSASLRPSPTASWLPALVCALAGAAVFQFFGNSTRGYIDTASLFYWWGFQWVNRASETEHGWLILGLSAWLLWRNLQASDAEGRPEEQGLLAPALAALLGALALHLAGYAVQQARVSIAALLLFIWGVLRLAGGRRWGRAAAFPLAFMLFAVPINFLDTTGFYLRLWVTEMGTGLAHAFGIGVVRNGTQLLAPDGRYNYDVAAACSGVRSLMAMLALAVLAGYVYLRSWWLRGAVLALALPAVFIGNVVRITAIILAAQAGGQTWGNAAHAAMNYGIFIVVLGVVLAAVAGLQRFDHALPAPPVETAKPPGGAAARAGGRVVLIVLVAAAGVAMLTRRLDALPPAESVGLRLAADGVNPAELPPFLGTEWVGRTEEVTAVEREVLPPDTGFSRKLYFRWDNRRQPVLVSLVLSGHDRTSIHRPELCLVGQGWTILGSERRQVSAGGRTWPVTLLQVETRLALPDGGSRREPAVVVYWFIGGDSAEASTGGRLWRETWDRLAHWRRDRWAYVLAQTPADDGPAAALARVQIVLAEALPPVLPPR